MTDIDETTGLPRLPEGYFWRVGGTELKIVRAAGCGKFEPCSGDLLVGVYCAKCYGGGYRRREAGFVEGTRTVRRWLFWKRETTHRYRKFEHAELMHEKVMATLVCHDFITAEKLPGLCDQMLPMLDEKLANEAVRGDYPPKRLEKK